MRYAIKAAATDAKKGPTFPTLGVVCYVDLDVTFVNHLFNVINVMQVMTNQTDYAQKDPQNAFALNTRVQTVEVMPANRVANKLG